MKKIIQLAGLAILFTGCVANTAPQQKVSSDLTLGAISKTQKQASTRTNYINIKYRTDPININDSRFEYLNTSKSSFVRSAWYDEGNDYVLLNLKGVYYHYCNVPSSIWVSFKNANSFGKFYNKYIHQKYDCTRKNTPEY